jgi:hypothetical protein
MKNRDIFREFYASAHALACTRGHTHNWLFESSTLIGQFFNCWCVTFWKHFYTEHIASSIPLLNLTLDIIYYKYKKLKDEVGMAVPKSTQTKFVGIITSLHLLCSIIMHLLMSTTIRGFEAVLFQYNMLVPRLSFKSSWLYACGRNSYYYETLDHIPSSWIIIMVHVVKGRQYSAYTVHRCRISAPQSQRWSLRPTRPW